MTARFRNESIPLDTVYSKIVHKKSTNFVVFSELGRFPIHYQIIKQMLGYWHHLENLESSLPLLKAAYNSSKKLFLLKKPSWYGSIHYIKEKIPGLEKYLSYNSSTFKQHCKCKKIIKDGYILWWEKNASVYSNGKLRCYYYLNVILGLKIILVL